MGLTVGQYDTPRGEYVLAPKGYFTAKLVNIKDLGLIETEYKGKKKEQYKALFTWELEGQAMEDGRPYSISQRYTLSGYENSKLRQHVSGWLNRNFSEDDFKAFDLESLLQTKCQIFIEHRQKDGKTFANVVSIGEAPQISFASLSKKIEQCWTHPGIDTIKNEAINAKAQGLISPDELGQLAAKSREQRAKIDQQSQQEVPQF